MTPTSEAMPVAPPEGTVPPQPPAPRRTAPAPGTAYHRMVADPRLRWWHPLLTTLAVLALIVVALNILYGAAALGGLIAGQPMGPDFMPVLPDLLDTALGLAAIATALPIVLFGARFMQSRRPGTVSSVTGRLRWGWLGTCLLLAAAAMAVLTAGVIGLTMLTGTSEEAGTTVHWVGAGAFLATFAVLVALVPVQAAAEEYVFRGWLLQAVGAVVRSPWPAIALQAVLFALLHGLGTVWGFVDLLAFATILAWLTIRTGGLEAAIALHTVNNLVFMTLAAADGSLNLEENAGGSSWEMLVVDVPVFVLYAVVVSWLARRRKVQAAVPAGPVDDSAGLPPHGGDHAVEQVGRGGVGEVAATRTHGE